MTAPMRYLACAAALLLLCATVLSAAERRVLKESDVRTIVGDYLRQKTDRQGVELNLKRLGFSGEVSLPAGEASYEVVAPRDWEGWGRASLALIVRINDRVERNIPLNVEVEALADVVVATRPLERGEVVEKGDVVLQRRDLAAMPGRLCRTVEEAVGKRVKIGLRGNSPVRSDYLERLPIVRSGQLVTIVAENSSFRITATGRSKGNGAEGEVVLVQNLSAQKEVPAVVVDSGTVRVEF